MSESRPILAVTDRRPEHTVIWHVQTDPGAAAVLSGAWLADAEQTETLLTGAVELPVGSDALTRIHEAIVADLTRLRAAAKAAKEAKPSLTVPRFEAPETPDPASLLDSYHGEEGAGEAWAHAVATAQLVDAWRAIESQRRSRAYLVEEFGAEQRPLPLG
ncbi:hypothetical protein [Corynebacterium guangdongense]|uniref:Uncharacterized protein n=1 Tax=Corynebacterium guangdongense TaxID=1783348 RepID=A0ABU2A0M2_9CORY|nr:hypothetical protein [Corynebacterium guangdongense]MDR7330741.1 hypothetical protein [Corynebacterium guangdongense]WJZ16756.1 hypothetical protein CGUA_00735 [Corynebacterium guangdongense]